jgi:hypothetical protein
MIRKLIAGLLIVAGAWIAGITLIPQDTQAESFVIQTAAQSLMNNQSVSLRIPRVLPQGEQVLFELAVTTPAANPGGPAAPTQLEARLDLPGVDLFPADILRVPYRPGQPVSFRWLVTAQTAPATSGTLWLVEVGQDAKGEETRRPLMARQVAVDLQQVVGLSIRDARWLGGGLAAAGLAAFWVRLPRRKKGKKSG